MQKVFDFAIDIMISFASLVHFMPSKLQCYAFYPDLVANTPSAVINVSSQAAFQPVPFMAVYAASKAFVQSFSQAIYGEWQEKGIEVQTLVPGPTKTEFDEKAGAYDSALSYRDEPEKVVDISLKNLGHGSPVVSPVNTYKQRWFAGTFPSAMIIKTVKKMFRPPN